MADITWEEAAQEAADLIYHTPYGRPGTLDDLDAVLGLDEEFFDVDSFARMGAYALEVARTGFLAKTALKDISDTVVAKQHDYGHGNILRHGLMGIVVRMCDKVARIRNLEKRLASTRGDQVALNEPLGDSWRDLVGYSIVAIMLLNGTFELPLAADIEERTNDRLVNLDALLAKDVTYVKYVETESGRIYRWSDRWGNWFYGGTVPNARAPLGAESLPR